MSGLMQGKRGLIMGVANNKSIAWGLARTLADHGAELSFTYQGEAFGKRVKPLAETLGSRILLDLEFLCNSYSENFEFSSYYCSCVYEWIPSKMPL